MKNKNIIKLIFGTFLTAMIFFAGCQKMEIVKVVGFIQGHAFDGNTNAPLDSVKIVWSVAGVKDSTIATAEDGYLISNLPEGEYSVWSSKNGYTTVVYDKYVGNELITNSTVRGGSNKEQIITYNPNLYPLNAGISGRLYRSDNGVSIPTSGVMVQLDYNSSYEEAEESYRFIPNLFVTTTDANGYYTFSNIPATDVVIRYHGYTDVNGISFVNNSGTTLYLQSGTNYSMGNVTLAKVTDDFHLINTNIWSSTGVGTQEFDVTSDLTLTFNKDVNQAVTESTGSVILYDKNSDIVETAITYSGNTITINPEFDLEAGANYSISYNVYSVVTSDAVVSQSWNFKTLAIPATVPAQVTDFALAASYPADNTFDFDDNTFNFDFTGVVDGIVTYEFWAKDIYNNQNFVLVHTLNITSNLELAQTYTTYGVTLPNQFDHFPGLSQTPLSHSNNVTIKMRAVNTDGVPGPWSAEISMDDQTKMTGISVSGGSTTNNVGGTEPLEVKYYLNFPEYVDLASTPTFSYTGTVTSTNVSFRWSSNYQGEITITVPAGDSFATDQIDITNFVDSSGNISETNENETIILY